MSMTRSTADVATFESADAALDSEGAEPEAPPAQPADSMSVSAKGAAASLLDNFILLPPYVLSRYAKIKIAAPTPYVKLTPGRYCGIDNPINKYYKILLFLHNRKTQAKACEQKIIHQGKKTPR
jgi:hypothetical protein